MNVLVFSAQAFAEVVISKADPDYFAFNLEQKYPASPLMDSFDMSFLEPSMSNLLAIPFSSSPLQWELTKQSHGQEMQSVPADQLLNDATSADATPDGKRIAGTELQRRLDGGEIGQNLSAGDKEEVQKLLDSMKNGELSPDGAQRLQQLLQPSAPSSGDDDDIR